MSIKTVFLSSTSKDLTQYREAAYRAIERLDGYHCVRMEDFGARNWRADAFCRAKPPAVQAGALRATVSRLPHAMIGS